MMKKVMSLCLMLAVMPFVSCSGDDDGSQDPIIGTWHLFKVLEDGIETNLGACKQKSTTEYGVDGNFTSTPYVGVEGNCIVDGASTATWKNLGPNTYSLSFVDGDVNVLEVTFKDSTFSLEHTFEGVVYTDVYKRVE